MHNKVRKISIVAAAVFCALFFVSCNGRRTDRIVTNDQDPVARLTIHTFDGSYGSPFLVPNFGHSFLSVKNLLDYEITVGAYTLGAGQEVSVGLWAASGHNGVWYNLESVYYDLNKYDSAVTLSKEIGSANLQKLTKHILSNDEWTFFYNCSAFAIEGWNSVSKQDKIAKSLLPAPADLKTKIQEFMSARGAAPIKNYGKIGYILDGQIFEYVYSEEA